MGDGVTVAKSIDLEDRQENMGAQLIKSVASKTDDSAGDGTTTATVLTQAITNSTIKHIASGRNPMDLKKGMEIASKKVIGMIEKVSKLISTKEEITQVATISANNDKEIGQK